MASPLNLGILDINRYIEDNHVKPVTSVFIRESSSSEFDNHGLFSEDIFGQVGTPERLSKFGYIDLKCKIIHPIIYNNILKLARWHAEIMSGKAYAKFDPKTKQLVKSTKDEGGETGYSFFINNILNMDFGSSKSLAQQDKIDVIKKNASRMFMNKMLVIPAGWRDVTVEDTKVDKDSMNKLYTSLINYSRALPAQQYVDPIYDPIMFAMQKKVCEIFTYLFDIADGKKGFFQRKYGSRNIALGTRNVISTMDMSAASPTSGDYLKVDEVGVPLFQVAKMVMPLMVYGLKTYFFNETFSMSSDNIAVVNQRTYELEYIPVTEDEKNKFLSSEGIEKIINLFRDKSLRHTPVVVIGEDDTRHYLYLMYDTGKRVYKCRSITEIKNLLANRKLPFDKSKLRPMVYSELIYIAAYLVTKNRYADVTRYPAIGVDSLVPSRLHVLSTTPSRIVQFSISGAASDKEEFVELPNYPVIDGEFVDSTCLHPSTLKGLGGDFDGDTVSINAILSKEGTDEHAEYLEDKHRYISTDRSIICGKTDIINLTIHNLSRDP